MRRRELILERGLKHTPHLFLQRGRSLVRKDVILERGLNLVELGHVVYRLCESVRRETILVRGLKRVNLAELP